MAAGTSPIFCATPRSSWANVSLTANAAYDGTGTVSTVFTAGANGSKLEDVFVIPLGTQIATVIRFFINNGSTNATPANNTLVYELTLAANTASQTAAQTIYTWKANLILPAGYKLNCCTGTTVASTTQVTAQGGDY